jgi:hypothetical protein
MSDGGRAMSYGEKAVGLDFNPSGDAKVAKIKALYAEIIDICDAGRMAAETREGANLWVQATREAQTAQMWAVKAATWR